MGLSKTGTHSLGTALTSMGYKNIHMDHSFTPHLAHDGNVNVTALLLYYYHHSTPQFDFSHRYDGVDSVESLPTAFYYTEMLEQYPTAKFVLTTRAKDDWYLYDMLSSSIFVFCLLC